MGNEQDELLNHEYDGIREYDNPTPAWWNWIFFGTFVFSVGYVIHYGFGHGVSVEEAYAMEMEVVEAQRAEQAVAAAKDVSEDKLAELMTDASALETGQSEFAAKCAACHGKKGEGLIGPNLTDAYWIHGDGSLMAIRDVVYNGVVEKGMVAWGKTMPPDELNKVVVYVGTMRGKDLPGKAPEGEKSEVATK